MERSTQTGDPPSSKLGLGELAPLELILSASGTALLLVFLLLMRPMLYPPVIAAAGIILLWPVRKRRPIQALLLTGGFLLLLWFFNSIGTILVAFGSIYLVAYLFHPVVSYLHRHYRIARWLSALVVTSLFISIFALCILLLAPHLIGQIDTLGQRTLGSLHDLHDWLLTTTFIDELEFAGIDKGEIIQQITGSVRQFVVQRIDSIPDTLEQLLTSMSSVVSVLTGIVIAPAVLFYSLKDFQLLKEGIKNFLPTIHGNHLYLSRISIIVGRYIRGQLTISAITVVVVSAGLLMADIPFALLIGIAAGLLNMIPNLGAILTNLLGISIAIIFGERGFVDVIFVVAVLFGQSLFEQMILIPKILSHHVGLHPILILFSLFVFGHFFGVVGLFVAVPATALLSASYNTLRREHSIDLSYFLSYPSDQTQRTSTTANPNSAGGVTLSEDIEPKERRTDAAFIDAVPLETGID